MSYHIWAREEALPSDYSSTCVCLAAMWCCCWSTDTWAPALSAWVSSLAQTLHSHRASLIPEWLGSEELLSVMLGAETALPSMSLSWHLGYHFSQGVCWECPCHSSLLLGLSQALNKPSCFPSWGRPLISYEWPALHVWVLESFAGLKKLVILFFFLSSLASTFLILNKRAAGKLPRWFFMELKEQGLQGDFLLHTLKSMEQILIFMGLSISSTWFTLCLTGMMGVKMVAIFLIWLYHHFSTNKYKESWLVKKKEDV